MTLKKMFEKKKDVTQINNALGARSLKKKLTQKNIRP